MVQKHSSLKPYNTSLSHFVPNQTRNCIFCDIIQNPAKEDEASLKKFLNCELIENLVKKF
jgi:hypothetical protein